MGTRFEIEIVKWKTTKAEIITHKKTWLLRLRVIVYAEYIQEGKNGNVSSSSLYWN